MGGNRDEMAVLAVAVVAAFALLLSLFMGVLDWNAAATNSVAGLVVVAGWFVAHRLNVTREKAAKRREGRVRALEAAYLRLASSSNRPVDKEVREKLEAFMAEIQLYGTPRQIGLAIELGAGLLRASREKGKVNYDELLCDLRDELRAELGLETVTGKVWALRFPNAGAAPGPAVGVTGENATG